jgi:hypothetical protein
MNLATTYLGFRLPHPFIVGSGPLADDIGMVCQLEDAGAAAFRTALRREHEGRFGLLRNSSPRIGWVLGVPCFAQRT